MIQGCSRLKLNLKLNNLQIYSAPKKNYIQKLLYIIFSSEIGTFSYNAINKHEIAEKLSKFLNTEPQLILNLIRELESNRKLRYSYFRTALKRPLSNSLHFKTGRYITNYVCIRILRPDLVIEAGIEKGIGSLIYSYALKLNKKGNLMQFDIDPNAGEFHNSNMIIGDCIQSLELLDTMHELLFYISDSVYGNEYSMNEIEHLNRVSKKTIYSQNTNWADTVETHCKGRNRQYSIVKIKTDHILEQEYRVSIGDLGQISVLI